MNCSIPIDLYFSKVNSHGLYSYFLKAMEVAALEKYKLSGDLYLCTKSWLSTVLHKKANEGVLK